MTMPKAEQQTLLHRLTRYLALEADAVETYALAACQLADLDDVEAVGEYRTQHEAQRDELSRLVCSAGGAPFDALRPRRPTTRERCVFGGCADDERRLAVLRDGEWARMIEYEAALRLQLAEPDVRNALERGFFGCRTRLRWLEHRCEELSTRRVAALTPRWATARRQTR